MADYFEKRRAELKKQIDELVELQTLNLQLHQYNWMFIHPHLFSRDFSSLQQAIIKPNASATQITSIFAEAFYDFRTTILLTNGYVFTCPAITPFARLIDAAIVSAIQHDYAAAINILVPVIEGSMRNYLINEKGKQQENIMRTDNLLQTFTFLKEDYCMQQKGIYERHGVSDQSKLKRLLTLDRQFFGGWIDMIQAYFANCLYLHTRGGPVADRLNRHSILHGFSSDVYEDLSNFLKVFHTLYFLAWAFRTANLSLPQHVNLSGTDIREKWIALQQLRAITTLTLPLKTSIYSAYDDFDEQNYKWEPFDTRIRQIASMSPANIEEQLLNIKNFVISLTP